MTKPICGRCGDGAEPNGGSTSDVSICRDCAETHCREVGLI